MVAKNKKAPAEADAYVIQPSSLALSLAARQARARTLPLMLQDSLSPMERRTLKDHRLADPGIRWLRA